MNAKEAAAFLDLLNGADPERVHGIADDLLLEFVPKSVADAYRRLQDRCDWWAAG